MVHTKFLAIYEEEFNILKLLGIVSLKWKGLHQEPTYLLQISKEKEPFLANTRAIFHVYLCIKFM